MTAVPVTAVAVGTTSMPRLELQACCYCDSRVRLRELHQRVALPGRVPTLLTADPPRSGHGACAVSDVSERAGSQIACATPDRRRKTVAACDERGDETNRFSGTKRRADTRLILGYQADRA